MIRVTEEEQKEMYLIAQTQLLDEYRAAEWIDAVERNRTKIFNVVDGVLEYKDCLSAVRGSYFFGVSEYVEQGLAYRFKKGKLVSNYKVKFLEK